MPGGTGTISRTRLIDDAVAGEGLALAGHDQAVRAFDGQAVRRLEGLATFLIGLAELGEQPLGVVEQPRDDRPVIRRSGGVLAVPVIAPGPFGHPDQEVVGPRLPVSRRGLDGRGGRRVLAAVDQPGQAVGFGEA